MQIVPLDETHCEYIVALHMEHLRTRFHGRAGKGLLWAYYAAVAQKKGACGYVAVNDGKVVGYICGVWDEHQVKKILFTKYLFILSFWCGIQLINSPGIITDGLARMKDHNDRNSLLENEYELRPIVVSPEERGTGLAGQLVEVLMADAQRRGYAYVYLLTEDDNHAANHFYQKVNFHINRTMERKGQLYNQYVRSVY